MWQVFLTLMWGVVVSASFVALGRLLARALVPSLLGDVPLTAGIGMAGMVFMGGLLNLARLSTSDVMMALVVAVVVLEGLVSFRNRGRPVPGGLSASEATGGGGDRGFAACAAVGLLLMTLTLRYVLSLGHAIHKTDDLTFYLPQLVKLLQTGTLGVEPYLFRQMQSLNGYTFLAALGCCVAPLEYAHLVDPGICWIIFGGLIYTFLRRDLGIPIPLSAVLAAISLFVRIPEVNLGGQVSGAVLMVTALRLMFTGIAASAAPTLGRLVLAGLVLASLSSLKSTLLIYAGLFVAFWSLLAPRRTMSAIVTGALPLVIFTSLFISPWMIQQYLSSGTLLYPILGKGYMVANHGYPLEIHEEKLRTLLKFLVVYLTSGAAFPSLVALFGAALYFAWSPSALSRALLAGLVSAVLSSCLIGIMVAGSGAVYRFTSLTLYVSCAIPGLLGIALAARGERVGLVLACAFFVSLGYNWQDDKQSAQRVIRSRLRGEKPPESSYWEAWPDAAYAAKIRHVQLLTEPGKRILANVTSAFCFDFRRNPIWNFDFPGFMSPPPGLPLTRDWRGLEVALDRRSPDLPPPGPVADFRDFLVRSGVDYLIFERDPKAVYYLYLNFPAHPFGGMTNMELMFHLVIHLTHKNLLNLARDRHPVFDDGNMILLDLRQGRQPGDLPFVDVADVGEESAPP